MREVTRRHFLTGLAAAGIGTLLPRGAAAEATAARSLHFAHLHTGERLRVDYFTDGQYHLDALHAIDQLLRDFRTGDVHVIDRGLLDLLHQLTGLTGTSRPYEVISGYRSPATNRMLRSQSEGVAGGSLHMQGQAIDIRLADVRLDSLRQAALAARRGGVGYYPASNFVHVDTGRVRTW